tara:strand:- start:39 stop:500 length:462 start_codon:yes stop_codon:yes gene_type:complete
MDFKEIKRLVELVEEASISHLSLDENGTKIEIKKEISGTTSVVMPQAIQPQPVIPNQAPAAPAAEAPAPKVDSNLIEIKAQMVGTYYNSPNPESPPFLNVGDRIEKGQVLCIIEAMKLFNEIESEESGIVKEICVSNEQSVEFGKVLFRISKE